MGETPDELKLEVEQARGRLDQDLNQLEYRFRAALDWRAQLKRHPWLVLTVAFGGAALVSAIIFGSWSARRGLKRVDQLAA